MSEDQIQQLSEGIKDVKMEIKLVWTKLNDISLSMAKLPCEQHNIHMKHSNDDIHKHIQESDSWRKLIVGAFLSSIVSIIIATSIFTAVKTRLQEHIIYTDKAFAHILREVSAK